MEEELSPTNVVDPDWPAVCARLRGNLPSLYELEPGGALMMDLGEEGWLLELTPDRRLLCQMGMDLEDTRASCPTGPLKILEQMRSQSR